MLKHSTRQFPANSGAAKIKPAHGLNTRAKIIIKYFITLCGVAREHRVSNATLYKPPSAFCRRGTKCDCKIDWMWVRSLLEEMKYLLKFILPFLRSGVEAKRGVEFCHSTCNTSRFRQKVGNGVS